MIIKKKRQFLAIILTALTATLFVPGTVGAVDGSQGSPPTPPKDPGTTSNLIELDMTLHQTDVELTQEMCSPCKGHYVHGISAGGGIVVKSGVHDIIIGSDSKGTISDATIDFSGVDKASNGKSAFIVNTGATVNLYVKDGSKNKIGSGDGKAGILVPEGATLNILKDKDATGIIGTGTLEVCSSNGGAGIGGESNGDLYSAGKITLDGVDVTVYGGKGASGIGGTVGGSAGDITIKNSVVKAFGGNSSSGSGGSGIGCGTGGRGGSLTIQGKGSITAIGGLNSTNDRRAGGITPGTVSSDIGSGYDIYTNSIPDASVNSDDLNSLVWTYGPSVVDEDGNIIDLTDSSKYENPSACTIYGDATLTKRLKEFGEQIGKTIYITGGTSLTIPEDRELFPNINDKWNLRGSIEGTGKLINANQVAYLDGQHIDSTIDRRVLLREDDFIGPREVTYTGFDLSETVLKIREERSGFPVDTTGWIPPTISGKNGNKEIVNADEYTVTYHRTGYTDIVLKVKVNPASLKDCTINKIDSYPYTGQKIEPPLTVQLGKYVLEKGADYAVDYDKNTDVGTAKAIIKAASSSTESKNFIGENSIEFTISPISIEDAKVTVVPESILYNGKNQEPESVEVSLGETILDPANYKIEWSNDEFIDAGAYKATITGTGNYGGTVKEEATYTISPIQLKVTKAIAQNREFDNTVDVNMLELELDRGNILARDRDGVTVDQGMVGKISAPDKGSYGRVSFDNVPLSGSRGHCYVAMGDVELTQPVEITQRKGPSLSVKAGEYSAPEGPFGTYFLAKVESVLEDNAVEGYPYEYEYKVGEGEEAVWRPLNEAFEAQPDTPYTITIRTVETPNIASGQSEPQEVTFAKLDQDAPAEAVLSEPVANLDSNGVPDGTYTISITPMENAEYSFDGENFSDVNTKTDCEPDTSYAGYVRFKATPVLKASEAVQTNEVQTSTSKVETPLLSADSDFRGSKEVNMSCSTKNAEIHYTLDGTDPNETSKTYTQPITIEETATVKAIAIKAKMEDSAIATATYTKTGVAAYETRTTTIEGIRDISADLSEAGFGSAESIEDQFRKILAKFNYEEIAFYDMTVSTRMEGGWQQMNADNFPAEGLTVKVKCPVGTSTETHDFAVSHMHSYTSDRLGVIAGTTEEPRVTETEDGELQFDITSASPLAIAWKTAGSGDEPDPENPNNQGGDNQDPSNQDPNQNPGDGSTTGDGTTGNGTSGDGTTGTGRNADGSTTSTQNGTTQNSGTTGNAVTDAVSSILPKTGDPVSFIPWIAAAVISIGVVVVLMKRGKSKKKAAVRKTTAKKPVGKNTVNKSTKKRR